MSSHRVSICVDGLVVMADTGWAGQAADWRRLERNVQNLQWRRTQFAATHDYVVPAQPGVYLICGTAPTRGFRGDTRSGPRLCTVLYAGQGNLQERFRFHTSRRATEKIRQYCRVFAGHLQFWFALTSDAERAVVVESSLIHAFRPPCNRDYPPVD